MTSYEWETCSVYGTTKHSCYDCAFYLLEQTNSREHTENLMRQHCERNAHGVMDNACLSIDDYIEREAPQPPRGVIITLGYLCWNTATASEEGSIALVREADRLRKLGCEAHVVIVDNGSTDDTLRRVKSNFSHEVQGLEIIENTRNFGISAGRNQIIEAAVERKSTYVMLMDGDIEVVPLSSYVMVRYLECHTGLGCIGAYSSNYTDTRLRSSKALYEIPESRVHSDIKCAWTQYGMFRGSMFTLGRIRFDESGPFGEPGWGYEDDDFYWQMDARGYENRYFSGMTYLHRNIRSSFPNLREAGVDVKAMFDKRKAYLINKWSKRGVSFDTLRQIEAQSLPQG